MKQNCYSILFSLEVVHSFFENNICNCLLFEPTELTQKVMKRFGFFTQQKNNHFIFLSNSSQPLSVFFDYIKNVTFENAFNFSVKTTDENFWLYTELPLGFEGQIDYSSERKHSISPEGIVTLAPSFLAIRKGRVGGLRIFFDDILSHKRENEPAKFKIELTARSTQWQYYVINKNSVHVENPGIDGRLNIAFDGPTRVTIPSGEEAMLFTSANKLLPLSVKPSFHLNLMNYKTAKEENERAGPRFKGKILFKGLPWPDPRRIAMAELNGNAVFASPMYIYL